MINKIKLIDAINRYAFASELARRYGNLRGDKDMAESAYNECLKHIDDAQEEIDKLKNKLNERM